MSWIRFRPIVLCVILFLTVSSCSSGGETAPATAPAQRTKIVVGVLPIVDAAALHIAIGRGYFAAENLEVEPKVLGAGAEAIPGLTGGTLQFAFGNYVSFFTAQANGTADLQFVADGYQAERSMFMVMAPKDSTIRSPEDLAGKRVAVNARLNIVELTARSSLLADGIDPGTVTFVEVPFPEMQGALQRGYVDAAFMVEPYITDSQRTSGTTAILDAASGPTAQIPIAAWAASAGYVRQNPEIAAAFQRAIVKGQTDTTDRSLVEQTVTSTTKVDQQVATLMRLGSWPTTMSPTRMRRVLELMRTNGAMKTDIDLNAMIFRPGLGGP